MKEGHQFIDIFFPDYRRRHIFTTKLRLAAFACFVALFLFFFFEVLNQVKLIAAIILSCSLVTGFSYYNIIHNRLLPISFLMELLSDLIAITVVVYVTGGPFSPYFTVYLFYVFVAGTIYNHYLAAAVSVMSAVIYGVFLILCHTGVIPPMILNYGDKLPIPSYTPIAHFIFSAIFLGLVVYTVKVAIYFSHQREIELEKRNKELTALHRVSSAVRSVAVLKDMIDSILFGAMEGLGFETVVLVHFDRFKNSARFFSPKKHKKLAEIENVMGRSLEGIEFEMSMFNGPLAKEMFEEKIVLRKNLSELALGLGNLISKEKCDRIQAILGIRGVVALPLVVEGDVIGGLIGFTSESSLPRDDIPALESFANQAAMSLEAAVLVERLRRVNDDLKRANEVKSEFLATMSHELRTPLTAIIGFSELLIEGVMGDLTDEQKDSLKEVLHNAADLLELINSLLDLTKIESGRMVLDIVEFDLATTLRRVAATIAPLIQKKNQKFEVNIGAGVGSVKGDERKIQQVILNLLANANKFTGSGGSITVLAHLHDSFEKLVSIKGAEERIANRRPLFTRGGIEVCVVDTGIGIPEDQKERIFEMFHQADGSITRSFGGTGLGLSLARRFVEMHGGCIWVDSEPEKGAKFTFILPLKPPMD